MTIALSQSVFSRDQSQGNILLCRYTLLQLFRFPDDFSLLKASPFQGEGHRKVWARLRVRDGAKVGRRRVLRIMRENHLLSPYRGRRSNPNLHQGEIITQVPNLIWGTDGARIFTVEDGWGWLFIAEGHWNAECMGWHVCKQVSRFAALEPISQGLMSTLGSAPASLGRNGVHRMNAGRIRPAPHKAWCRQAEHASPPVGFCG